MFSGPGTRPRSRSGWGPEPWTSWGLVWFGSGWDLFLCQTRSEPEPPIQGTHVTWHVTCDTSCAHSPSGWALSDTRVTDAMIIHLFCCTWPWVYTCDESQILPYLHVIMSKCTWCYFGHFPWFPCTWSWVYSTILWYDHLTCYDWLEYDRTL